MADKPTPLRPRPFLRSAEQQAAIDRALAERTAAAAIPPLETPQEAALRRQVEFATLTGRGPDVEAVAAAIIRCGKMARGEIPVPVRPPVQPPDGRV